MGWKWNDKAVGVEPPQPVVSNAKVTEAKVDEHGRIVLTVQAQIVWGDAPK